MGYLTTHVLDTAAGKPGDGISLQLFRLGDDRKQIYTGVTNADGRTDKPILSEEDFALGTYEIVFDVGDYFAVSAIPASTPPFLGDVVLRFTISEDQHYHVPLLVSPWSYSTYRGS